MAHLGLVQRLILTAVLGGALGTVAAAAWWYVGRDHLRTLTPNARLSRLLVMAAVPVLGALLLTGAVVLPSLLHATGIDADHCGTHPSHHLHLCFVHTGHGHAHVNPLGWLAIGGLGLWLVRRIAPVAGEWLLASRELSALRESSPRSDDGSMRMVPSDQPLAATVGWLAPSVLVSETLAAELSEAQLRVVTAHEQVHARGKHPLLQASAAIAGALHLSSVRRFLSEEIELACEQIADREAARSTDGAVEVADTILAVEKLCREADQPLSRQPSIDGGDLERRVVGLLEEPWDETTSHAGLAGSLAAFGLVALSYSSIHHGLETLFALVL